MRFPRPRRKRRFAEDSGGDDKLRQLLISIIEDADGDTLHRIAAACDLDGDDFDDADDVGAIDDDTDRDRLTASPFHESYIRKFSESAGRKIAEQYFDQFADQMRQAGYTRRQFIDDFRSLTPRHKDEMANEYRQHLGGR